MAIIEVEDISKSYMVGERQSYGSLREEIMQALSSPFRRAGERDSFWALRGVSFSVEEGEVFGIIGRNGAGKSTLLKILSRITEPTGGRAVMRGRVASLLEVGAGFHPELTGRENIFLNGSLLGMSGAEIRKKFDEMVAFSEIEKFLDTPVKRYSSGMYVRLAFAVAAHLEPEILIVDEVLAVGDAVFQKKCLGKMGDVAKSGRTVLFVSHNMAAVSRLCTKGILLDGGVKKAEGPIDDVVEVYLNPSNPSGDVESGPVRVKKDLSVKSKVDFRIEGISVTGPGGEELTRLKTGDSIRLRVDYTANERLVSPALVVSCKNRGGVEVFRLSNMPISGYQIDEIKGKGYFELIINEIPLLGGVYYFDVGLVRESVEWYFNIENAVQMHIEPTDVYGSGMAIDGARGLIAVPHKWKHVCG